MLYDKPGQSRAKCIGSAPHMLEKRSLPHEVAADQFAKDLSGKLIKKMSDETSLNLKIVAEAKLLGKLKKQFTKKKFLDRVEWITKDLEKIPQDKWSKSLELSSNTATT